MRVASWLVVVAGLVPVLGACEADLGQCDMTAATQLLYASDGTPYYPGQALVQQSCAGSFCHANGAVGASRFGAPHGLNFDVAVLTPQSDVTSVVALRNGLAKIRDRAEDMFGQVDDGAMPPGKVGERPVQTWSTATGTVMPLDITTGAGKDTLRNWLACGAPVISGTTGAVAEAATLGTIQPPKTVVVAPTFQAVYDDVLSGSCKSCHFVGGPYVSQTTMDFSTKAAAYASLVNKDASATGSCVGRGKLVIPNNCADSLLFKKLLPIVAPAAAVCGSPMPLGAASIAQSARDGLCGWINAGALQ